MTKTRKMEVTRKELTIIGKAMKSDTPSCNFCAAPKHKFYDHEKVCADMEVIMCEDIENIVRKTKKYIHSGEVGDLEMSKPYYITLKCFLERNMTSRNYAENKNKQIAEGIVKKIDKMYKK